MFRRFRRDRTSDQPAPPEEGYGRPEDEPAAGGYDCPPAEEYHQEYAEPQHADYAEPQPAGQVEYAEPQHADYAEPQHAEQVEYAEPQHADYAEPQPAGQVEYAEPQHADYAEPQPAGQVEYAGPQDGEHVEYAEPQHPDHAEPDEVGHEPEAGRRHRERADLGDPHTWTRLRDGQQDGREDVTTAGPWDSSGEYPELARVNFGSLLVPVREGYEIQAMVSEEEGVSVAVVRGESALQLQPFAAPRSSGLWPEVMPEIAQEVSRAGGQSAERDGPFGPELVARVVPQGAGNSIPPQPLRFIGVDGPRWFLRGLVSGPAAMDEAETQEFRDILADVVVVRGEHALPPRQPLQVALPEEARESAEVPSEDDQKPGPFDPFERGPEITETR